MELLKKFNLSSSDVLNNNQIKHLDANDDRARKQEAQYVEQIHDRMNKTKEDFIDINVAIKDDTRFNEMSIRTDRYHENRSKDDRFSESRTKTDRYDERYGESRSKTDRYDESRCKNDGYDEKYGENRSKTDKYDESRSNNDIFGQRYNESRSKNEGYDPRYNESRSKNERFLENGCKNERYDLRLEALSRKIDGNILDVNQEGKEHGYPNINNERLDLMNTNNGTLDNDPYESKLMDNVANSRLDHRHSGSTNHRTSSSFLIEDILFRTKTGNSVPTALGVLNRQQLEVDRVPQ
ncbi:hypothetical protein WDU94_000223 [Cyamophila willieti]